MEYTLDLELYRDKMPDEFAALPGAEHFDASKENLFWAVLTSVPPDGSPQADFIKPAGPDSTVSATTHGTDTLPEGIESFTPTKVCIWHPKTPPYKFTVTTPTGGTILLDPPEGTSDDQHAWLCLAALPGEGIGIWTLEVENNPSSGLPQSFGGRNAHLNPASLDFTPEFFEQQPLLRVEGKTDGAPEKCAELLGLEIVSGCAPGTVSFEAAVDNVDAAVELTWDFGDGSALAVFGAGEINDGLTVSHNYASPGSYTVVVNLLRMAGCSPLVKTVTMDVPPCEGETCANLHEVQVVTGCAPGSVEFHADIQNPLQALEIGWDFGDGTEEYFSPQQIAQGEGIDVAHTYPASGPYTAIVTVVRQSGCSPLAQSESVLVPVCEDIPPKCAELLEVEVLSGCAPGEVTLSATIEQIEEVEEITWDFGDGSEVIFNQTQVAQGSGVQLTHSYTNTGDFVVVVTVLRHAGCTPRVNSEDVTVNACEEDVRCPQLTGITVDGCMPEDGPPANLTFQAQGQNLELAQEFEWDFGDGSAATTQTPTTNHSYNNPGPFDIQVTMTRPENCSPSRQSARLDGLAIPACEPPQNGTESCLCTLLRVLGLAFLIVGAGLIFGGACSANIPVAVAGGVIAVIGAVLLIVWAILCGRSAGCRVFQSLISLLGIITVVLAIIAVIFGILAIFEIGIPCLIGTIIDLGIFGVLSVILTWIFYAIGCRWQVGATFPF